MLSEPHKRFPKVSDCCNAPIRIHSNFGRTDDEETAYLGQCTKCDHPCEVVIDEGLEPKCNPKEGECAHCGNLGDWSKKDCICKICHKIKCKYCYDTGTYSVAEGGSLATGDFIGDLSYHVPLRMVEKPCPKCSKPFNKDEFMQDLKDLNKVLTSPTEITWACRFHPTDWFHEIGCPHMDWTKEQLQSALETAKRSHTTPGK